MQCRICFEDGTALTLQSPCQCRGTSRFIHTVCLDRYIQYYPDRICRVCRTPFQRIISPTDVAIALAIGLAIGGLLLVSTARVLVKLILSASLLAVVAICLQRCLLSPTSLMAMSTLILLFLPGGHPTAVTVWILSLGAIAILYTLSRRVPPAMLLSIVLCLVGSVYGVFLVLLASVTLDPPAFTAFVCILCITWAGWLEDGARL